MKLFALLSVSVAGVCVAGPAERAIVAAMALSEESNYSWTSTVQDDVRTYDIQGKVLRGGFTWVRLPMVKAIAQRLGREADIEIEAIFRGPHDFALATSKGWQLLRELPPRRRDWGEDDVWMTGSVRPAGVRAVSVAGLDPWDPRVIVPLPVPEEERSTGYSNAQFALSHPHDELAVIVSSCGQLNVAGNVVTGTLSDLGAQLLLVREGQDHITPICAAGTFTLHLAGGSVTKYALRLEGILEVNRRKVHVHQSAVTTVSRVGTTRFDVPEEVQRKLGR